MTATNSVLEYFKDKILKGEWRVGQKLPIESEICEMTGIGRSGVREAVKILESSNIVNIRRGDGTYLSEPEKISFTEPLMFKVILQDCNMEELFAFRESMEMALMRLAFSNADQEDLKRLELCNQKMRNYIEQGQGDVEKLLKLDLEFHKALAGSAHNMLMEDLYQFTFDIFGTVIRQNYRNGQSAQSALETHEALLRALKKRDFIELGYAIHNSVTLWGTWGTWEKIGEYLAQKEKSK